MHAVPQLLAYIPAPPVSNPHIGSLTFHLYGLILGIGVLVAVWLTDVMATREGAPAGTIGAIAVPAVVMGFVGGRIYHVISQPEFYWHHKVDALEVWHGGLGVWGGIALGVLTGILLVRHRGLRALPMIDAVAPGLAFAQGIGRWGNYVNQELFGRPSHLPWALRVTHAAVQDNFAGSPHLLAKFGNDTLFQPTFLYESIWDILLGFALILLLTRWNGRRSGAVFAIYVAVYSLGRLGIEHLRVDEAHTFAGLRQNEWLAIVLVAVGVIWALWLQLRSCPAAANGAELRPMLR